MSIPVALADLREVLRHFGPPYLLSTDGTRLKAVHVAPVPRDGGDLLLTGPGGGSRANVATHPEVTLVWPPLVDPGFSLIVDGVARVEDDDVVVTPSGAVLHKPVVASDATAGHPFWVTAVVDLDAADREPGTAFWAAVTGTTPDPHGQAADLCALLPPDGHGHVGLRRRTDAAGPGTVHLDLHVPDVARAADRAVALGADEVRRSGTGHGFSVTLRSPGGVTFCVVGHPASLPPSPVTWAPGHASRVEEVGLDVVPDALEAEVAFWSALTGRTPGPVAAQPGTSVSLPGRPLGLLVQAAEDTGGTGPAGAHLAVAATDRAAETARHVALGATVERECPGRTVLRDPGGMRYRVVDVEP